MNSDVLNWVMGAAGTVIVGLIGWLSRHSNRLTTTEANVANNTQQIRDNSTRADNQFAQISSALVRIEDKLDRKVDR